MKKKIILMGVFGLLLPLKTYAFNGSVSLTCDKTKLNAGETTTCTVKGNTVDKVSGFQAKIRVGENLTIQSGNTDSSWQGDGYKCYGTWDEENERCSEPEVFDDIQLYTDNNKKGEFNLATFTVKAGSSVGITTSVSLDDVVFTDASFADNAITVAPVSIRIPSNVNTLSMIKLNDENMSGFSSSKFDYQFDTDYSKTSIKIGATATDSSATISGDIGSKTISYGTNKFTIKVKAESGAEKEYVINVIKHEGRELKSLKLNDKEITLESGKYNYNIEVENNVDKIVINAILNNDNTTFVDKFGNREATLNVGNNEILVKTKDANNEELTYKITVNRLNEKGESIAPVDKEDKDENKNDTKNPENPKTGVKVSFTICSIILIIGAISFIVIRKKDYFKKI